MAEGKVLFPVPLENPHRTIMTIHRDDPGMRASAFYFR